jgi:hypothetical protein
MQAGVAPQGVVWPAMGFAIWHFAPLSVHPNSWPGGARSFVLVADARLSATLRALPVRVEGG